MQTGFSLTELLPRVPHITIAHIGASILPDVEEPYAPLVASGHAHVVAFEPNPEEYRKLVATQRKGYTYHPYFIGEGGPATYFETAAAVTGSLLEPNMPLLENFQLGSLTTVKATHPVDTRRLDDIAGLAMIDYLKIDVQGAEVSVFKGAERLLHTCLLIETEVEFVELYRDQPLFGDVDRLLRTQGFQFHTLRNICGRYFGTLMEKNRPHAYVNQMLWADAVYMIDFAAFESLSENTLAKLAVLLHDVYGSIDFCMAILKELDRREDGADLARTYLDRLAAASQSSG